MLKEYVYNLDFSLHFIYAYLMSNFTLQCTLHFMLSSSVEIYERGDEAKVCRLADTYRYPRNIKNKNKITTENVINDVETLSSDEM